MIISRDCGWFSRRLCLVLTVTVALILVGASAGYAYWQHRGSVLIGSTVAQLYPPEAECRPDFYEYGPRTEDYSYWGVTCKIVKLPYSNGREFNGLRLNAEEYGKGVGYETPTKVGDEISVWLSTNAPILGKVRVAVTVRVGSWWSKEAWYEVDFTNFNP